MFIGRTDVEAETPILWPPDMKSQLIWKDPDTGKEWGQEKGMTENEMVGWHHRLNGHEFGWNLGVGDGQGGLVCCGTWGHKESDTTEWLNWTELNWYPEGELLGSYNRKKQSKIVAADGERKEKLTKMEQKKKKKKKTKKKPYQIFQKLQL